MLFNGGGDVNGGGNGGEVDGEGGCGQGCRITVPHNNPSNLTLPPDGQCPTTTDGSAGQCIVYELSFFHANCYNKT